MNLANIQPHIWQLAATGFFLITLATIAIIKLTRKVPYLLHKNWQATLKEELSLQQPQLLLESYLLTRTQMFSIGAITTGIISYFLYFHGTEPTSLAYGGFFLALLLLCSINLKHALFPDVVVITLLWCGLLFHAYFEKASSDYLYGAALGYVGPSLFLHLVKIKTGKQIFGFGDVKMMSMMGAWFGMGALPSLLMYFSIAVIVGAVSALIFRKSFTYSTGLHHAFAAVNVYWGINGWPL